MILFERLLLCVPNTNIPLWEYVIASSKLVCCKLFSIVYISEEYLWNDYISVDCWLADVNRMLSWLVHCVVIPRRLIHQCLIYLEVYHRWNLVPTDAYRRNKQTNSICILFCKTTHCGIVAMQCINFCILALGSGFRVRVRVSWCNATAHTVLHVSPPNPDPNRYRRRCPDPNARIQKFRRFRLVFFILLFSFI